MLPCLTDRHAAQRPTGFTSPPCCPQATWLPQDLKYGPQFRAATRFKGAHADLKAQLRSDDRPEALAYQPRPQGTGSSQGIMDWKVGCCVTVISLPLTVSVFVFPSLAASFSPPAHWQDHYQ